MSMQLDAMITCPHCGHKFAAKIYRTLWVEEPKNRELFLNDEVNKIVCPSCKVASPLYEQTSLLCVDVKLGVAVWHEPRPDNQISIDQELYRKHMGEDSFYAKAPRISKWEDFKKKFLEMETEAIKNKTTPNAKLSDNAQSIIHGFAEHIKSKTDSENYPRYLRHLRNLFYRFLYATIPFFAFLCFLWERKGKVYHEHGLAPFLIVFLIFTAITYSLLTIMSYVVSKPWREREKPFRLTCFLIIFWIVLLIIYAIVQEILGWRSASQMLKGSERSEGYGYYLDMSELILLAIIPPTIGATATYIYQRYIK